MNPEAFYIIVRGEQRGPYTVSQLDHLLNSGLIGEDATFWREGLEEWQPITNLVQLRNKPARKRWIRRGVLIVILVILTLVGRFFGPTIMEGWREMAQYEFTESAAYWRARDVVRQKALPAGTVINFASRDRAEVHLQEKPQGASVRLSAEVLGEHGQSRHAGWTVRLQYDPQLKEWSGVDVKSDEFAP